MVDQNIRYMVVEDQDIVSLGLTMSLEEYGQLELLGIAKDGEKAVEMALSLKPDLIIMDLGLPKMDGIEATRQICQTEPGIKVLIMSSREKARDIFACFAVGASAYYRKEASASDVYAAMQAIMNGQWTIEPAIAGRILTSWRDLQSSGVVLGSDGKVFKFSDLELQIITLWADGLNNDTIAAKLGISVEALIEQKQLLRQSMATLGSLLVAQDHKS